MPSMGARKPGQGRVSGERSERNLDPVEHARTLSRRSEPVLVSTCRRSELVAAARSRAVPADPTSIRADDPASITTPAGTPSGACCSRLTRATPPCAVDRCEPCRSAKADASVASRPAYHGRGLLATRDCFRTDRLNQASTRPSAGAALLDMVLPQYLLMRGALMASPYAGGFRLTGR